ncbi:unnamed protein product [Linum trigynum]|uniref:Uncharacterized protein n=1 Tax=Linum trigynum TaxID=586398 RepID=A0AAV2EJ13_9ROSI
MAAIVSQVLGQLGSIVTEELKQRGRLVLGAEKDVKKLTSTFTAIEALLLDAEERQLKDEGVQDWLKKLKDVSYEIDDVLDEWRTEILKGQLEGDDDAAAYGCLELKLLQISSVLKRVCPFLPAYCFSTGEIGLRYDIASKIKSLNEHLEDIDKEKNMYNFTPKETTSYSSLQTSPNINFSEVKGREEEIKILLDMLLDDGSDRPGVRRMSIQGPGGFGKTTLAKMLYNDKAVEAHFDKRVWVCVSNNFDQATVGKVILEFFDQSASGSLSYMLKRINIHMTNKKFLLVLDDVWEDSQSKWEELITSVSSGLPGSMILVTTRKEEVSRVLGCIDDDILHIQKISEDACLAIFMQIAFNGWRVEEKERVENLCDKAVEKCFGSPLAAKVLGGVLCLKRSKRDWIQLLRSEMWQMREGREEVLAPLALSFYDLPPAVRECFQFCAIFPQDYKMEKDELIKLWMSQGFLKTTTNQDMEEVGKEYFRTLVMRSFFQDLETYEEWDMTKTYCKMHDLVHDFARLTTKNECINIIKQDTNSSLLPMSKEVRHLMVEHLSEETNKLIASIGCSGLSSAKGNGHLRSFIAISGGAIERDVYAHLRGIRSLVLVDCDMEEIPATITHLIHLRLLDLSYNSNLKKLPEEICELYNLETLILNHSNLLLTLPSGMGNKLINLKHLENYHVLAMLPRSIVRLGDALKTLTTFNVVYDDKADSEGGRGTNIGDLECMNRIQGFLTINGLSRVTNCEEMKRAQLVRKESLTNLLLDYQTWFPGYHQKQEQVLEAIRPSSSLEGLVVQYYQGGSIFPGWLLSLSNLTSLNFNFCYYVEHLPPLGALPSLEELYLSNMDRVNKIGLELLLETSVIQQQLRMSNNKGRDISAFPKLTLLCFRKMKNWEVWDLESDDDQEAGMISSAAMTIMPRLRCLELGECRKLEKVPDVLLRRTTLERLVINESGGLGSYRFSYLDRKMVPNEVWDKISHIPTILLNRTNIRTRFKNEIESMSGIGCSYSKQDEGKAGDIITMRRKKR